jgi:O-antigen ligase
MPTFAGLAMGLMLAVMVLKPFSRLSEAPLLILAIIGIVQLCRRPRALCALNSSRALLLVFACFWLPMCLSTAFAVDVERSLTSTLAMLRYLLAGLALCWAWRHASVPQLRHLAIGIVALLSVWAIDAAVQAVVGVNLLGEAPGERLNGLFGQGNLKLAPMMVLLLAPALHALLEAGRKQLAIVLYLLVGALQLIIATRAAWVMFALLTVMLLWPLFKTQPRKALALLGGATASMALVAVLAFQLNSGFHERVMTTSQALHGDREALDFALSARLPIWQTAWNMIRENPLTGVGIRGFRDVYTQYASEDDPWVAHPDFPGAYHAHHIMLEVAAEAGLVGLVGLLLASYLLWRQWRGSNQRIRQAAWPWLISLCVIVFPLNTHYAIYSTDWSMTLWWFVLLCVLALNQATGDSLTNQR